MVVLLPTNNPDYRLLLRSLIRRLILQCQGPVFIRVFVEFLQAIFAAERDRLALILRVNRFSNVANGITGNRANCVDRFLRRLCGWRRTSARCRIGIRRENAYGKRYRQDSYQWSFHGLVLV
jgi:hypothetical protein